MGLFKKVQDVTYTSATNSRAEQRQANARAAMRGRDGRGGLLGRMAGATKGGAVQDVAGQNPGSQAFQQMQRECGVVDPITGAVGNGAC